MRFALFSLKQCKIERLLDFVFVISGIIQSSVSVISPTLRRITLTKTLIILNITKPCAIIVYNYAHFTLHENEIFNSKTKSVPSWLHNSEANPTKKDGVLVIPFRG